MRKGLFVRASMAAIGATAVGYFWLILSLPCMFAMIVGNDVSASLGWSVEAGWGVMAGLTLAGPTTIIAAVIASGLGLPSAGGRRLPALGLGVTFGTAVGTAISTALWIGLARGDSQGLPIFDGANMASIPAAAFVAVAVFMLISGVASGLRPGSPQTGSRPHVALRAIWGFLLLWPLVVLAGEFGWLVYTKVDQPAYYARQLNSSSTYNRFLAIRRLLEHRAYSAELSRSVAERLHDEDGQVRDKAREYLEIAADQGGPAAIEASRALQERQAAIGASQ